ncbi:FAD/NAD(P)-binding protein [Micromonospora sp. NPDC048830]|uniref:FAD/NAD(P)-binding protein n=1 Tax=Micromonospora sp. NPDC048830 TaxID=3364257 RepID=UPI0037147D93
MSTGGIRGAEIAVVGGGASAVCLLDTLAQLEEPAGGVTIFEPGPHLWRGRPYQWDTEVLRLNATPDDMSVRHGDPGHFERWLAARDLVVGVGADETSPLDPYSGTRFAPRTVYGEYLEHSARDSLMALIARGWRVNIVRERVVFAAPIAEGAVLRTDQGRQFQADYVVLCVGGGSPQDSYGLSGSPRFLPDPYPVSRTLHAFDPDAEVGIIGSGLTAVDVVLALVARGHRGPISLLSRTGLLPAVRQRPVAYELRHFTPERVRAAAQQSTVTLDTAIRMLGNELGAARQDLTTVAFEIAALSREQPVARLRRQFADVDSASTALRIMQAAVPDTGPELWSLLPEHQKAELLHLHYRTVLTLCCPMPAASAATLLSLIDSGQLRIVKGLQRIAVTKSTPATAHDGGFTITTDSGTLSADHLVNAVNPPAHKIPAAAAPLIDSLVAAGVAARNPLGGLHVERVTSRLTVDGTPHPRFYALGDLAFGSLFFTFGIPAMVNRAHEIGASLRDHMSVSRRALGPVSALASPR